MKNTNVNHSLEPGIEQESKVTHPIVHVFKTNVELFRQKKFIIEMLYSYFPESVVSLDLDDCDKVLRVTHNNVSVSRVIDLLNMCGFNCMELQD